MNLTEPVAAQLRRAAVHVPERLVEGAAKAAQRPGPPSLVPSSESVEQATPRICPKRPYVVEALERPDLRLPATCDAYSCTICGPRKATTAAAVMTWAMRQADRSRLVTLTLAPEDWQTRRQKARDFARSLRKQGYAWEWAWTTEKNPRGTGLHVHGIQHGARVPQPVLQDTWGAIVDVRAVRSQLQDRTGAAVYTVKESLRVAGYTVKGATGGGLAEHLDLNGGRAAHWSRGFLHGKTKREALTELRKDLADGESLTWRLVPAWHVAPGAATAAG
jgi:ferredoxin